ncbi:hypothetical protein [Halolamina rubra]|uniref:hypothetical protein n=1 Tax=Halolamina rubra TaxID=1380430 RepID=UPI000678B549|nr:hypothetical protein [Halolamina rubra]
MTDNERDTQDGIDLPSSAYELGVDATGATHYHSAMAHKVWVVENDEISISFDVDDIQDYRAHVADTRGWDEIHLSDKGAAGTLVDLVEEAIEGGRNGVSA